MDNLRGRRERNNKVVLLNVSDVVVSFDWFIKIARFSLTNHQAGAIRKQIRWELPFSQHTDSYSKRKRMFCYNISEKYSHLKYF